MGSTATTTQLADALPAMIGFKQERLGIPRCEWTSPCYLLADRDLEEGEVVRVWAVDRRDGRVLKVVELTATKDTCKKEKWPEALVKAIREDETRVNDSKLLHAGVIAGTAFEASASSHSTADCSSASSLDDYNRLWVFSTYAQLFTNAPFVANQVIGHNLDTVDFGTAQRLCVQVRDRVSQGLFESIMVTPDAAGDKAARTKTFCERVSEKSRVMRAGALGKDGISIAPDSKNNALWIPQLSNLAVTVEPAPWVFHSHFSVTRALAADEELRLYVHDDVTGMQLPGSPLIFTPDAKHLAQGEWPTALAETLKTSVLADYLMLVLDAGDKITKGVWKRAGVPLRILMSSPLEENTEWAPMLHGDGQAHQGLTVKDILLRLESEKPAFDRQAKELGYEPSQELQTHYSVSNGEMLWEIISLEVELQDARTGYTCYHSSLKFRQWHSDDAQDFIELLLSDLRRQGLPEAVYRPDPVSTDEPPASDTSAEPEDGTGTLWLPRTLGMIGIIRLQSPTKLKSTEEFGRITLVDATRYFSPILWEVIETYCSDQQIPASQALAQPLPEDFASYCRQVATEKGSAADDSYVEGSSEAVRELLENFYSDDDRYGSRLLDDDIGIVSDDRIVFPANLFGLKLDAKLFAAGFRFTIADARSGRLFVYIPDHSFSTNSLFAAVFLLSPATPWNYVYSRQLETSVDPVASFSPADTLCADRCMTLGAHVYDTGGARETGVDESTGLFHAHYPVATLRGLGGKGPELDLTLHYSAVRANEGALGDGWAFRFSYFDNRRRVLTLSSGQTLTLTKAQMKSLSADKASFLDQDGFRITAVEGDENAWSALTIQMPAGSEGRQEVLRVPVTHDGKEASDAFRQLYKKKLEATIANLTRWIEKEKITSAEMDALKKQRSAWQAELADIDRQSLILVTSSLRSSEGGELTLAWQGTAGHIRLDSVTDKDTGTVLLSAEHGPIVAQGTSKSTFTVWPDTPECYQVTLDIRNCLLESIKRGRLKQGQTAERHVRFGYDEDPALDRVLTSIAEEDGSVEMVMHELTSLVSAPRVVYHSLAPGAGQPCITHAYEWKGEHWIEQLRKRCRGPLGEATKPVVTTHWTLNGGVRVVHSIVEEQPGSSRRTTHFTYPATAPAGAYQPLLLARPIKTEVTTQALNSD